MMKFFFSAGYRTWAFNLATFILRITGGVLILPHGYDKLVHFKQYSEHFMHFLGMSSELSLGLVVFAEFFCAIFLILGLATRLAAIPLIIDTFVALAIAHKFDFFDKGEHAALYVGIFLSVLLIGPGKISVDGMINK